MPLWLKKILKSVRVPIYLAFLFFGTISDCFAITPNILNNFDFGTFTQTNRQASFILSYDGVLSSISNLTATGTPVAGKINYTTEKNGDNLSFSFTTSVVQLDGCTMTFSDVNSSLTGIVLNPGQGKSRDVSFGVSVSIDGFCAKGTHNVSGVQIDATGSKTSSNTTLLPITVVFNEHIEITEIQEMNFGVFEAGTVDGKVVIYPNGGYDTVNVYMLDASAVSIGKFTIGGLINREVQLSFSDSVLSNGASTMILNNLNADVGSSFNVSQESMPISVGGTLNVRANQPDGIYTGTYTLTVTY